MKTLFAGLLLTGSLMAESWSGTIVDVMCKGKDVANHTRQCALNCSKGGYGLLTAEGKFLKLDETGNAMAFSKLKASTKAKDLKAKVTGKMDGEVIQVEAIELQ